MSNRTDRELYEREIRRENQVARDSANTANGILLGVLLAAIAALVGVFVFMNQRTETQAPVIQPPDVNIEAPEAPEVPEVQPPDVNITVPEQPVQLAPETEPVAPPPVSDPVEPAPEVAPPEPAAPPAQ